MPTTLDDAMGPIMRLVGQAEALAAVGASLRVRADGIEADPAISERLDAIADSVVPGIGDIPRHEQQVVLGAIRALLLNAVDLLEHPERPVGWSYDDPELLQNMGRLSVNVVHALLAVAPALDGLAERLARPGARFLDVGTGAGWIAITMAREVPTLTCVGIDIWPPAVNVAKGNVAALGLEDRVTVRFEDVRDLDEDDTYDLAWLPVPFLPDHVLAAAVERVRAAVAPGGWVVAGTFGSPADPLAAALTELRTVRAGGRPWSADELAQLLRTAGCVDVVAPPANPRLPSLLVAGRCG